MAQRHHAGRCGGGGGLAASSFPYPCPRLGRPPAQFNVTMPFTGLSVCSVADGPQRLDDVGRSNRFGKVSRPCGSLWDRLCKVFLGPPVRSQTRTAAELRRTSVASCSRAQLRAGSRQRGAFWCSTSRPCWRYRREQGLAASGHTRRPRSRKLRLQSASSMKFSRLNRPRFHNVILLLKLVVELGYPFDSFVSSNGLTQQVAF
jgi:hypothetical protein